MRRKGLFNFDVKKVAEVSSLGLVLPSSIAIGLFMGYFLDKLLGRKKDKPPSTPPFKYPFKSIINDPDLKNLADFNRYYPLPQDHEYRKRGPRDIVVVRKSDGNEFVFLVEEGILAWDVPRQRKDGSWGKKTTEVLKQGGAGPHPGEPGGSRAGGGGRGQLRLGGRGG